MSRAKKLFYLLGAAATLALLAALVLTHSGFSIIGRQPPSIFMAEFTAAMLRGDQAGLRKYAGRQNLDYLDLHNGKVDADTREAIAAMLGFGPLWNPQTQEAVSTTIEKSTVTVAAGPAKYRLAFSDLRLSGSEATVRCEAFQLHYGSNWLPTPGQHMVKMIKEDGRWIPRSMIVAMDEHDDEFPMDFEALERSVAESVRRSRTAEYRAYAIGDLKTLSSAEKEYSETYGVGYSSTLSDLSPPDDAGANPTAHAAGLTSEGLASGTYNGWKYTYHSPSTNGKVERYTINADPLFGAVAGGRAYFVDETGTIRYSDSGPAGPESDPIE